MTTRTQSQSSTQLVSAATSIFSITPGASNLSVVPKALDCTSSGTVTVEALDGSTGTIYLNAGIPYPIIVKKVTAATATGIIGLV